ncbi:MAG TPA: sigma 54-interacting transcriptional regulator [Kofleriaceae bacterium]
MVYAISLQRDIIAAAHGAVVTRGTHGDDIFTGVVNRTVDDVSNITDDEPAAPAIVMVATGPQPASLVLPVPAELGRRIAAAGKTHEVDDERMSRDHALVTTERGLWLISDRDSRNGTFVDGERVQGEVRRRGDVVLRLGHTVFVLLADGRGRGGEDPPDDALDHVVGPELARVYADVRRHAASDTLLIHGESGVGKELAARLYHDAGPRAGGPFVAVNCAAIPEGVAERLLFGSKKGAFSGAVDAIGHFQMAHGGTLFLDEIADLDAAVQAKLLRVIETREVVPVGATSGTPVDIGVVAASHRELRQAVAERQFRDDLYYRLALTTVHMPPLRARKVDIARLAQREVAAVSRTLAPHARLIEACCIRPWPGNIRELRSAVRYAAGEALAAGRDLVRLEDLAATAGMPLGPTEPSLERPKATTGEIDKEAVVAALARANNVVSVAARALGLYRTQLYRLMDKYGISRGEDS